MPAKKKLDVSPEQRAKLDRAAARAKEWHSKNRQRALDGMTNRYNKNKPKHLKKCKEHYERDKVRIAGVKKAYRASKHGREVRNANLKDRRENDEVYIITERARGFVNGLKRSKVGRRTGKTRDMMQATVSEVRTHLKKQLAEGETLKTMHIDHIFPIAAYKSSQNKESKLMHYTNLQPLTALENHEKRAKLPTKAMAAKVAAWAWPEGVTVDMLPDVYPGWSSGLRR